LESAALNAKLAKRADRYHLAGYRSHAAPINPYYIIVDEMTEIFADGL
jgi:hypothetical protein